MATGSVVLALIAGILSVLSPCVLPILPVVLGAAASEHKSGPVALAAGLTISFVVVGLSIATIGYSIGLDGDVLRYVAAALIHMDRLQSLAEAPRTMGPFMSLCRQARRHFRQS